MSEKNEQNGQNEQGINEAKEEKTSIKKEILSWIWTIGGAVLVAIFITQFIIVNANVPTGSMKNTIMPKDRIIANRLAYKFDEPERFDIVVFKYPDDENILYVKRIIGLPGDKIEIIDGKVYINDSDEPINDDFIREAMAEGKNNYGPYNVPEGCYFMLGDNRNDSRDSRFWINTFVEKDKILGKVIFRYYPNFSYLGDK